MLDATNASAPPGLRRSSFSIERLAPLFAGIALAAPTLAAFYPPMTDLALHEGVVGILRHWGDDAYFPRGLYELNLGHPNQLFHGSAWLLSWAVGTRWAVKVVIALSQVLILLAGARLADHLGRSRWSALLLAPLALGFTYFWGLVANLVGYAMLLFVLPVLDRAASRATPRLALAACGCLVLLSFAHGSVFIAGAGTIALFAVCHPLSPRKTALRLAPLAFAAVFQVSNYLWERGLFTAGQVSAPASYFPLSHKVKFLPNVLFGSHELTAQLLLLSLALIGVGTMLAGRLREARVAPAEGTRESDGRLLRLQGWLRRYRFEVLGLTFLVGYFTMPFNWRGATLLHERFLTPAWAFFVLSAAPRVASRLARVMAVALPVGILFVSWPQFVDSNRTERDLDGLLEAVPLGSAVAGAVVDRTTAYNRTRIFSMGVSSARVVAVRGGRTSLSLAISPISPVQLRPALRWNEYDARIFRGGSWSLQPTRDLDSFGYLIVQSRDPEVRAMLIVALSPDADHLETRGEWMLFRSRHAVRPVDAPEAPPTPPQMNLLQRVVRLDDALHGRPPRPEAQ